MATLPNGQRARLRISPAPASARSVNQLRAQLVAHGKRQSKALTANAGAIRKLGQAQAAAVKKITSRQDRDAKSFSKQLAAIEKRVATMKRGMDAKQQKALDKQRRMLEKSIRRQRRRSLWNDILLVTAMPMFAAYGDTEDLLSRDNLVLTGSTAGWLLADDILDQFMGRKGKESTMRSLGMGADAWSYLAPAGNLATLYLLMRNKQHERIITGLGPVTFVPDTSGPDPVWSASIPLTVADDYQEEFNGRTDLAGVANVTAPFTSNTPGTAAEEIHLIAAVSGGNLVLTIGGDVDWNSDAGPPGNLTTTVAWMVDTDSPNA